jgi:hypothetical protein
MQPMLMALSISAMFLGVVVLYVAITRIVRLLRDSEVARIPVAAEARVAFDAPGTYILHVDQPRLSMAMLGAKFALRNDVTETEVRSSPVIVRTTSGGFSTARVSVRSFDVDRAGRYLLMVTGVDPGSDLSQIHLIFTRPYTAALFLLILVTVFGGACLIGGLVFTALQFSGKL